MKKILIAMSIFLVLILMFVIAWFIIKDNKKEQTVLMIVSDVSMKCISNEITIYSNGEYLVKTSTGKEKQNGKLNYKDDLEDLVNIVKTYKPDMATLMNYKIELNDGEIIYAAIKDSKELNELLALIPLDNLFWCE